MPAAVHVEFAPAKLNLALAVGPPDADGMHPVCSWMVTVDLCDELTVTRLPPDRLARYAILWHPDARRRSEIDWPVSRDLAVRAHLALERLAGRPLPVQLKLQKRIPVGGGLGGGSSNAAAMLRATNRLFELGLDDARLRDVAATLGADVPFFVAGGSATVEGRGERLRMHGRVPEIHAVIVFPELACPTGRVYAAYDELGPRSLRGERVSALVDGGARPRPGDLFNDLTAAAIRFAPALSGLLEHLGALAGRPAHLAGSGSSLFVLADDALHAEKLAAAAEDRLGLPTVAVRTTERCQ
jgi:4-diphosphocytidyl-2-C-methyl-D-erythritol kinase